MKLKELLIEKHMTQKELSLRTGITEPTISRYVNKERECGLNNAYKIAIALGIEIMDLLEYKPQSYADKMFKKLGYEILFEDDECLQYEITEVCFDEEIKFDKKMKTVLKEYSDGLSNAITLEELQAINEKCRELGW